MPALEDDDDDDDSYSDDDDDDDDDATPKKELEEELQRIQTKDVNDIEKYYGVIRAKNNLYELINAYIYSIIPDNYKPQQPTKELIIDSKLEKVIYENADLTLLQTCVTV